MRWAFWIAAIFLLALMYPLSLGPFACAVDVVVLDMLHYDDDVVDDLMVVYYPVFGALQYAPQPIQEWYNFYVTQWYIYLGW